jgi:transcriptional regulator with XRE-family HTH domain
LRAGLCVRFFFVFPFAFIRGSSFDTIRTV